MKKPSKPLLISGAIAALSLASIGVSAIHAASTTPSTNPMSNLVAAIAQRFNLKQSDVQQVFDEQKSQMETQRTQDFKSRLDQAVKDGKLTQAQEDLIVGKEAEEQTFRDSLKSMNETDRRTAMQDHQKALQQWATDNSIPQEYLPFGRGGHMGPGHSRYGMGEMMDAPTTSASPTTSTN